MEKYSVAGVAYATNPISFLIQAFLLWLALPFQALMQAFIGGPET